MRFFGIPQFTRLFDGEPGGGGAQPGDPTPPAAPLAEPTPGGTPPAPTPAPTPPAPLASPAAPAPGPPDPNLPGTPPAPEDRSTWVSPERVNQIIQGRLSGVITERDRLQAMLEAGTGVRVGGAPAELSAEEKQAKDVMMNLLGISQDDIDALTDKKRREAVTGVIDGAPAATEAQELQWSAHGSRMLDGLHTAIAEVLGVEPANLTEFQRNTVGQSYAQWLRSDPQLTHRYTWGDPGLAGEFVKLWQGGFADPARRVSQAGVARTAATNAGMPSAPQPGGVVPGAGAPAVPKTEDETHDAAWQAMLAARRGASVTA